MGDGGTPVTRTPDGAGSPYAPHDDAETAAMLSAVGVDSTEELFDVPESVRFDGDFGIEPRSERAVREEVAAMLGRNDDLVELLGRGHYDHYVPSLVDHISQRAEFLTSYTQYQPEIAQGFLQVLFEYQSLFVELTGLEIVNCSMYDAATALGEAATLADRVRSASGHRVLVPEQLRAERRDVLENYVSGTDLVVEPYPMADGNADRESLADLLDEDAVMVYAETPTVRGTIEEGLSELADLAHDQDALFCLGSDPVALSLLEEPASVGADVVVGDASVLGLPASYGMGLGLFATREEYVRQVPGRLVGASDDADGRRAYTLTLQTREQHIRKERATSNICTNQAWVALRTAIHAAWLGPSGLVEEAERAVTQARDLAARLDAVSGVDAPVNDRHHFREFVARTDRPADDVAAKLVDRGFAVHAIDDHELQICATDHDEATLDEFVAAVEEVLEQ
ncbi:glycine dehydrogenase (decarboxylating) alpha subunit [Natronoarchaeum philippinense]|uniref:glycine dehydrogenase (aminomethyl-transferring) n=2 Tax=Natronoarchaeum philippinense TaxID=558529 RepID=A0A285NDL0_NATPI|nr:glycine dehydrogenase (decarboxylating) alpha subunit [Natronoarchaeum philippinense]